MAKKNEKTLTEEEIKEDVTPEGVGFDAAGEEVPEETAVPEAEPEAPSDKARPPKDYIKKALELIGKQRKGDESRELFVAEQSLLEAIRFIEKHEKKGGA